MWRHLLAYLRRSRLDDELGEEIELHVSMRREALIGSGLSPSEADAAARRQFGNVQTIREDARALWSFRGVDAMAQDLRYALRLLLRAPWFTAVAVLSLVAGIGSAATIFTLADAVLWRPLPVPAPQELRAFGATIGLGAGTKQVGGVDSATLQDLRERFDSGRIAGFQSVDEAFMVTSAGARHQVRAEGVTADYFAILGVRAAAGRLLSGDDAGTTVPMPVILSERLWRDGFQRDAAVLGRILTVNDRTAVVVGVTSAFRGVVADRPADLFVPLADATLLDPGLASQSIRLLLRLDPDASVPVAEQKLASVLTGSGPSMMRSGDLRVRLMPAPGGVADTRAALNRPLTLGFLLAGVLVLVSCANAGGLLVARFAARQGEFGLRSALGASRARLLRQLGIEALLLSAISGGLALFLARVTAPLLLRLFPATAAPPDFELRFDGRLVAFTAAAAGVAALISGSVSIWRALRTEPADVLKATTRTVLSGPKRLARSLILLQVAASMLLVVGATSVTRTLFNLRHVEPGFEATGAFAVRVDAGALSRDPSTLTPYFRDLYERLHGLPSIEGLTLAQFGFMSGAATTGTVDVPGFAPSSDADRWVRVFWIGPAFFETMRIPILAGRAIDRGDLLRRERIAVVSRQFAHFYYGSAERAVGRTVNGDVRIVGVAADAHYDTLREPPARAIFTPFTQSPPRAAMTFIVRPAGDVDAVVTRVLRELRAAEPRLGVRVTTLPDQIDATLARERFLAIIALALSCIAVFLSCAALYAAVAYATAARTSELAVRLALGATRKDIVSTVLREPIGLTIAGLCLGLPGAYGVTRAASSLLYGVHVMDLLTIAIAGVVLLGAAVMAAVWPALRAGRVDPLIALRTQ